MKNLPATALVLVAIMPSLKDLEIPRVLGWYRIPMRMTPKIVDVDYIVFYQTGNFPEGHGSLIESYAEVLGHELTTRAELIRDELNHPHANEEYFKLQYTEKPNTATETADEEFNSLIMQVIALNSGINLSGTEN